MTARNFVALDGVTLEVVKTIELADDLRRRQVVVVGQRQRRDVWGVGDGLVVDRGIAVGRGGVGDGSSGSGGRSSEMGSSASRSVGVSRVRSSRTP